MKESKRFQQLWEFHQIFVNFFLEKKLVLLQIWSEKVIKHFDFFSVRSKEIFIDCHRISYLHRDDKSKYDCFYSSQTSFWLR